MWSCSPSGARRRRCRWIPEPGPAISAQRHLPRATYAQPVIAPSTDPEPVEINVAFGTEKRQWLEEATAEFHKAAAGRGIKVNLHGMGSMEAARAVIDGPQPVPFHVWSPASSAYRDAFERNGAPSTRTNRSSSSRISR